MRRSRSYEQYGQLVDPDWVSAYADVFAAVGTVGAFVSGGWLLHREIGRDRDRVDEKEREQASQVHAWVESLDNIVLPDDARNVQWMTFIESPDEHEGTLHFRSGQKSSGGDKPRAPTADDRAYAFCLEIKNLSAGPIFDVYVEKRATFAPNTWPQRRLKEADRMLADFMPKRSVLFRPVQADESFKLWYGFYREKPSEIPMSSNAAMAFTDCFGLRWRRDRDGRLTQIGNTENPEWVDDAKYIVGL